MRKQIFNLVFFVLCFIAFMVSPKSFGQGQEESSLDGGASSCYYQFKKNNDYSSLMCSGSGGTCSWQDGRGTTKQNCP